MWWVDVWLNDEYRRQFLGPFASEQEAEEAGLMFTLDSSDYHVWKEFGLADALNTVISVMVEHEDFTFNEACSALVVTCMQEG